MKKDNELFIFLHLQRSGGTTLNGHLYSNLKPEIEFIHLGSPWASKNELKKLGLFEERPINERNKARVITGHKAYYGVHKFVPQKSPKYITFLRNPADRLVSFYNSINWANNKPPFKEWYKTRRKNEMVHFYSSKFLGEKETTKVPSFFKRLYGFKKGEEIIFLVKKLGKRTGFFGKQKENGIAEFENAKKLLDLCWYVGITESSKNDFKFLFRSMGIPIEYKNYNVTGKNAGTIFAEAKQNKEPYVLDKKTRSEIYRENSLDLKLYKYAIRLNRKHKRKYKIKN